MRAGVRELSALCALVVASAGALGDEPAAIEPSTAWELRALGLDAGPRLDAVRRAARRRPRLAIVGGDGVSAAGVGAVRSGTTLSYRAGGEVGHDSHDTQMLRVVLGLTAACGVDVDVRLWQAGPGFHDYAAKFEAAAAEADVVLLFQSFWGRDAAAITSAIRAAPGALFISPYVEHGGHPTSVTPQGSAARPWEPGTIEHLLTVAPLARRAPGEVLSPSARGPGDTEAISLIAPSWHAGGPGGTCPSAAVAGAAACVLLAIAREPLAPLALAELLRATSGLDPAALAAGGEAPAHDAAALERLSAQVARLRSPPDGGRRTLDAAGVIDLGSAASRVADLEAASR